MGTLAEKFKAKRKELKLSQKILAQGICEQSQISKIERGNYMPAADLLYKLAERLNVTVDYFFNDAVVLRSNLSDFKQLATKLLDDRNYPDLDYLYKLEKVKHSYLIAEDKAYLDWIQAILYFYLHDKKEEATQLLEQVLSTLKKTDNSYPRLLNTLSNFYSLLELEEQYEAKHQELVSIYQTKNLDYQEDLFGYIRVRYNYAHHLLGKDKKLEAIEEALAAIDICRKHHTSFQLAPLLTILANASLEFLDSEKLRTYYQDAIDLCRIFNHQFLLLQLEKGLKQLEEDWKTDQ